MARTAPASSALTPQRPRRRRVARIAGTALAATLASTLAPVAALPAQAAVAGMSAVDPQNGFPVWYSDGNVKLQLCYMAGAGCLSEPPNPDAPASYPDNFPEEAFWFQAAANPQGNLGVYEAALEAAHVNGPVVPGEQMGFARLRFRVNNLVAGASYTIEHPYGTNKFTATAVTGGGGRINQTIDAGLCTPTKTVPCNWAGVGEAFLGDNADTGTSTFVKQVGAAAGTLGDINTPRAITGAPSGLNAVRITGPNAGGPGINTLTVSQFTVQGLIVDPADGAPTTPDLTAASDSGRSTTDNITNVATPTFTGTVPGVGATEASVGLLVDGAALPAVDGATLNGAYSLTLPTNLAAGVHKVQARTPNPAYTVDPATGAAVDPTIPQYLTSGTLTFTVDTTAPAAAISTPKPSNPSADTTPTVPFTVEAGATAECQLLPSNADWTPCVSPMTYDQQLNGDYTFNVRATDAAGNVSAPASYSWRIGPPDTTPPTIAAQSPAPNATAVPLGNNVTVRFSEAVTGVNGTSMQLDDPSGNPVPASVTYNPATNTATLDPTSALASGTRYTLSLTNSIADVSGNLYAGSTSTFTTADTVAPTVSSRAPASGATAVSTTGNVTATFNEAVTGVSGTSFTLTDAAGASVPAAVTYNATTRTATLDPTASLAANSSYTAELSGGIADASGNPLAATSWTFTTGAASDTVAPTVTTRTPASAATGVATNSRVTATFSEGVQGVSGTTFTLRTSAGVAVTATAAYDSATRVATLTPSAALAPSTTYTATLTGSSTAIRDLANNPLATASWNFTTAAAPDVTAPTVSARTPASAATAVSTTGNITATFSENVQGVSGTTFTLKNAAGTAVAGAVTYNATTRVATLDPTASLAANTSYTATLTGGAGSIRDAANNPLVTTSWTFTTGAAADTTAPTMTASSPASGATGIAIGTTTTRTPITATFSENVTGVSGTTFTLKQGTTAVAAAVTYNATTRVATLTPSAPLVTDRTYTATLTSGIRDAAGNALATKTWNFITGTRPTVTAKTPASGATGVSAAGNVTVTFSEAVSGVSGTTFTLKNAAGTVVPAAVTYNATTRVATLDPTANLANDTKYTATATGGATAIRDAAGNTLSSTGASWTFTTGPAPTVTARTPAVNALNVSRTANVTATFSEAVTGWSTTTVTLKNAATGAVQTAVVSYNATTRVVTLNPSATLAANTKFTATLTTGIKDAGGNPIPATTWSFTTGAV